MDSAETASERLPRPLRLWSLPLPNLPVTSIITIEEIMTGAGISTAATLIMETKDITETRVMTADEATTEIRVITITKAPAGIAETMGIMVTRVITMMGDTTKVVTVAGTVEIVATIAVRGITVDRDLAAVMQTAAIMAVDMATADIKVRRILTD
jgi:hypothetical protein